jgi:hypothetical protein
MNISKVNQEKIIEQLLVYLEYDAQYLQNCLSYLDDLKKLVIKRDEASLRRLLEVIQAGMADHKKQESIRQQILDELAGCLDFDNRHVTLTVLEQSGLLSLDKQTRITAQKAKLKTLVIKLKAEYEHTARFLTECSRFNSIVLKSIFALGKTGGISYNAAGAAKRHNEPAFVNMRL